MLSANAKHALSGKAPANDACTVLALAFSNVTRGIEGFETIGREMFVAPAAPVDTNFFDSGFRVTPVGSVPVVESDEYSGKWLPILTSLATPSAKFTLKSPVMNRPATIDCPG